MKNLLKPSWLKIILFVLIIIAVTFIPKNDSLCSMGTNNNLVCSEKAVRGLGYPLFYGEIFDGDTISNGIRPVNLIINILGYYLLTSCIVFILKGRKNNLNK